METETSQGPSGSTSTSSDAPGPAAALHHHHNPAETLPVSEVTTPAALEVDAGQWENDSTLGDDQYTVTTSVASSAKDFRHEGGRRFHAFQEDAYFLPNDEIEAGRLDLQHYIWKLAYEGALSWVPLDKSMKTVLDIGTGTGIWAIEVAEAQPELQVIGTDLSPIQPDLVPPNCQFIVDNAEFEWAFDRKFGFIHSRVITMGMHDWVRYFQQCWNNLEPGGWIETGESQLPFRRADGEEQRSSAFIRWSEAVQEAALKMGIDVQASEKFTEILKAQGFVNVERIDLQWPVRAWAKGRKNKLIGRVMYENLIKVLPALGPALLQKHLGWSKEDVSRLVEDSIEDMEKHHFYCPLVCHRGQKPFDAV